MSNNTMLQTAEELVSFGTKNGATQIEVSIRQGTEFTVSVREGEIEQLTDATSRGLSLRVFVDGKMARASSSDFSKETLSKLVTNAIRRAQLSNSDPPKKWNRSAWPTKESRRALVQTTKRTSGKSSSPTPMDSPVRTNAPVADAVSTSRPAKNPICLTKDGPTGRTTCGILKIPRRLQRKQSTVSRG
jgi:PmbA/TldA metallopeptidase domain 1